MRKIIKFLDEGLEEALMVICLVIITLVIMLNVIMRRTGMTLPWPEELARYCYVYSGMLSAGYCLRRNVNFRVDLLYQMFPRPVKILIEYAGKILVLFLYAFMTYASFDLIATTTSVSTAMQIPMKYIYMSIPIGMTLGVIRAIQDLIRYTLALRKGEK